eukprot:g61041.t1
MEAPPEESTCEAEIYALDACLHGQEKIANFINGIAGGKVAKDHSMAKQGWGKPPVKMMTMLNVLTCDTHVFTCASHALTCAHERGFLVRSSAFLCWPFYHFEHEGFIIVSTITSLAYTIVTGVTLCQDKRPVLFYIFKS